MSLSVGGGAKDEERGQQEERETNGRTTEWTEGQELSSENANANANPEIHQCVPTVRDTSCPLLFPRSGVFFPDGGQT